MDKKAIIGLYVLFLLIIALLVQLVYNQYFNQIVVNPYSLENLKKAEIEHKAFFKKRVQNSRVQMEFFNQRYLGLGYRDVGKLFNRDIPLEKSNIPQSYVLTWATMAVAESLNFRSHDYKARLSIASRYFTKRGWQAFSAFLDNQAILSGLDETRHHIVTVPWHAPFLISEGPKLTRFGHYYHWVMNVPVIMTKKAGRNIDDTNYVVNIMVIRSDDEQHPFGIAIDRWSATVR